MRETTATLAIRDPRSALGLVLDPESGLPVRLLDGPDAESFPLAFHATLRTEGTEAISATRGFNYEDTTDLTAFRLLAPPAAPRNEGTGATYTVRTRAGEWEVRWLYTFRALHPRLELRVELEPVGDRRATLRDFWLETRIALPDLPRWRLEIPGNQVRPGIAADALLEPAAISPGGGLKGSSGLAALHHPERDTVFLWWPLSRTEIGNLAAQSDGDGVRLSLRSDLAARLSPGESVSYGALYLDLVPGPWPAVRDQIARWFPRVGLAATPDHPDWIAGASIFEVQIGFSVFWGDYRYAPYPTVRHLIDDLGRIRGLGYTMLQIMPRQPYPSYNVHDYADIATSYGDEADLRELVATCHAMGMRVILDILLHGVMDKEVMAQTAERVRSGPYAHRLSEGMISSFDERPEARDAYPIAWSRHILDFEPHWAGGSPPRHPLADSHPEWFMRDSAGAIIGIYTKAFDVANPAWQEYFCAATEELVRLLDVDGFRFDAPTYNYLPNWSPQTERRASYSPLGCLELFDRMRPRLKRLKESVVLYTEPSGLLFRQSMDITYNYDEQWLIGSLLDGDSGGQRDRTGVRTGRDLMAWFRDRNALLPPDALIAHHIDSHDTFWWPLPGMKWRREQYGLEATRALLAVFSLSGGAYMTFVGGEQGIEEWVRRVHRLRAEVPALGRGTADFTAVHADREAIYAVGRRHSGSVAVVLVNIADAPHEAIVTLDRDRLGLGARAYELFDAWNDTALDHRGDYRWTAGDLAALPLRFAAFQPRVLLLRPLAER